MCKIAIEEMNPYVRKSGKQSLKPWKNKIRKIYDHEFLYCISGKANITIEDIHYKVTPGTLVLIKPDRAHSISMDHTNPADMIWIHFDFKYRMDVYGLNEHVQSKKSDLFNKKLPIRNYIRPGIILENGLTFPDFLQVEQRGVFEGIFKKILYYSKSSVPIGHLECKILMLQLFAVIIKQLGSKKNASLEKGSTEKVEIMKNFISRNFFRKITVNEVALAAGLGEDYGGKLFKKITGENLSNYINIVRLQHAAALIMDTDLSFTGIAEMTGFSDLYYFSRVVKKYEGVSPTEWKSILLAQEHKGGSRPCEDSKKPSDNFNNWNAD